MTSSVKPLAGPGATPYGPREARVAQRGHALPDRGARVARAVGVVQQQHVEGVDAQALQGALGGHPQVGAVLGLAAQPRVGEAREALRALALALVEVVAHRADQRIGVAVGAGEGAAEEACRPPPPRTRRR